MAPPSPMHTGAPQPLRADEGFREAPCRDPVIQSPRFMMRRVSLGGHGFLDISASIGNISSYPLLGQSLLERLGVWGIDNTTKTLVFDSTAFQKASLPVSVPLTMAGSWHGQWRSTAGAVGGGLASILRQSGLQLTGEIGVQGPATAGRMANRKWREALDATWAPSLM